MKQGKDLLEEILREERREERDPEILAQLLHSKVSAEGHSRYGETPTFGQRAADAIARFAGSWTFIIAFVALLIGWMSLNVYLATQAFDPYPFILLNLVLSCIAAIQAPLIMMSQNRQSEKDRIHAENDYQVNLKNEFVIEDLHERLVRLEKQQDEILSYLKKQNKDK